MTLPDSGTAWPPAPHSEAFARIRSHAAWWSGDPAGLEAVYSGGALRPALHTSTLAGGIVGRAARMWWGTPSTETLRTRRHIPLPADMAEVSAQLLFSRPPTLTVPDGTDAALGDRLDYVVNTPRVHAQLLEAAESQAALGGVGLRLVWDDAVADHVMLDTIDADHLVPVFRWGRLQSLTAVTVLPSRRPDSDDVVWRHLERHEVDSVYGGVVRHGLYRGTSTSLGLRVPYEERPETSPLADQPRLVDGDTVVTGARGLTAAYVPNARPVREWRGRDQLSDLGRSDYAGLEPLFDALDEVWSSLMRDIDLGKGRITVPERWLLDAGPGRGQLFDSDRSVYSAISDAAAGASGLGATATVSQFSIRVTEHLQAAEALTRAAVKAAGYSPLSFGMTDEVAQTATEVSARKESSLSTREAKTRHWGAALGPLCRSLLEVDAAVFGGRAVRLSEDVRVAWPVGASDPLSVTATTVETLRRATVLSQRRGVAMLHPDWTADELDAEVTAIEAEQGIVSDPTTVLP